jgi:hypothetical protein
LKKIASFIPSHTTSREEVSKYFNKDNSLSFFLKSIDKVYFCFHNVLDIDYCRRIAFNIKDNLKNVSFLLYKTPSFNLAFASHLVALKKEGFTDLLYLPDDSACTTKDTNLINDVLNFYKKTKDISFVSLAIKSTQLTKKNIKSYKTLHLNKKLTVSFFEPQSFKEINLLDVINKPFLANIDYLLKLCDKTYSELLSKQEGDYYLRSQFLKTPFKILCLSFRLIRCFYYTSPDKIVRRRELHLMRKLLQHKKHLI